MPLQPRSFLLVLTVFTLLTSSLTRTIASPDPALDHTGYLISLQRFREAALDLSTMQHPNSVEALGGKSTLLLYVARAKDASSVFEQLRQRLPQDSSLPDYGEAVCDLMTGNTNGAASHLDSCSSSPDYQAHKSQIDLARAVLLSLKGDRGGADSLLVDNPLPLAKEIILLAQLRAASTNPANISAVDDLLTSWQTLPGVPMVTDAPGLRALGAVDTGANRKIIEPALSSPEDALSIAQILLPQVGTAGSTHVKATSGTLVITPHTFSLNPGDLVTYYVDRDVAAVINSAPFEFRWDTTQYSNGQHTITISVTQNGQKQTETDIFNVLNADSDSPLVTREPLTDADRAVIDDIWNLLTLQPSYKAAELQISRAEAQAGQRDQAVLHLTRAAAIDFEYAGGTKAIAPLYSGHMAAWFPVPPGSHVGSAKLGQTSKGIWCGSSPDKEVALTFDDGPSPTDTPPLLDALRDNNVPGTFLVVGIRAAVAPDLIRRMHSDGDEVEDHSYTHPNLDEATVDHIYEEILRDGVLIQAMIGIWPHFLRPPGGQSNPNVLKAAQDCGMAGAFWTIDVLPAEDLASSASVVSLVLGHVRPGAIVLMHNGASATTAAIPELARRLRQRGFRLVTLLELARHTLASRSTASSSGTR